MRFLFICLIYVNVGQAIFWNQIREKWDKSTNNIIEIVNDHMKHHKSTKSNKDYYKLHQYKVTTEDGYILTLHRLV